MAETQKERLMRVLKVSEEEAFEILKADKAIDRGERMEFDLDPETEKMAKKFANVQDKKKPIQLEKKPRPRKENATKGAIIADLAKFLMENATFDANSVEITNKERQIAFKVGNDAFELTLVQKRKPKS